MQSRYDYRPKWRTLVFCALFFGACAVIVGRTAATNERPLRVSGIELSVDGATIFLWGLAGFGALLVVLIALSAILRLSNPQRIVVTSESITVPRSRWSGDEIEITFAE
ncbi:MAG: hypothetical protein KDC38_04215, partial [Planctomycetes bacterium]|nr:hypothetical protein [Planctomycetota bacterium]